jgi:hypothetical protein
MLPDSGAFDLGPVDWVLVVEADQATLSQVEGAPIPLLLKEFEITDEVVALSQDFSCLVWRLMKQDYFTFREVNSLLIVLNTHLPTIAGKAFMDCYRSAHFQTKHNQLIQMWDGRNNPEALELFKVVGMKLDVSQACINQPGIDALLKGLNLKGN